MVGGGDCCWGAVVAVTRSSGCTDPCVAPLSPVAPPVITPVVKQLRCCRSSFVLAVFVSSCNLFLFCSTSLVMLNSKGGLICRFFSGFLSKPFNLRTLYLFSVLFAVFWLPQSVASRLPKPSTGTRTSQKVALLAASSWTCCPFTRVALFFCLFIKL